MERLLIAFVFFSLVPAKIKQIELATSYLSEVEMRN